MGLDNIPLVYPCVKQGTAVLTTLKTTPGNTEPRISCAETQEAGGCPWQEAKDKPEHGSVIGIMGTDCWYRGKYGNALLEEYGTYDELDHLTFYGDLEDGQVKSIGSCLELADHLDEIKVSVQEFHDVTAEDKQGLEYAAWYMRWVAEAGGGLSCWY